MKKNLSTFVLVLIFLIGLSLLLYPTVADYWNSFHQSQVIQTYVESVTQIDDNEYEQILEDVKEYNEMLLKKTNRFILSDEEVEKYFRLLDMGDGVMGYIEIDKIDVFLPIYHGEDEAMLQVAIGHMQGSSLPIGGIGTHSVIMGHRGLTSARLFTDLDQLIVGDTFRIHVLDEVLTYEVDQVHIVLPKELDDLDLEKDKDYMTLVTCTPYGVNSHRLLIRGHRVDTVIENHIRVTADALQVDTLLVAIAIAIPMLIFLIIFIFIKDSKKKRR